MFYYSIMNQTVHRILQPPVINHPNGSQCSCSVTESELSGVTEAIDTSDLKGNLNILCQRSRDLGNRSRIMSVVASYHPACSLGKTPVRMQIFTGDGETFPSH